MGALVGRIPDEVIPCSADRVSVSVGLRERNSYAIAVAS